MHSALEIGTRLGSQTARAVNNFGSIRHIRMQARVVFEIANCAVSCDSVAKTFLLSRGQPLARRGPPLLCRAPARVQRTGQLEQLVMRCIPPAYGLCLLYLRLQSGGQALVSLEAGYSSHGQQGQAGPAPPNPQCARVLHAHDSCTKIHTEAPRPSFNAPGQALASQSLPSRTADPNAGSAAEHVLQ